MRTFEDFYEYFQLEIRERALRESIGADKVWFQTLWKESIFTSLMLEHLGDQGVGDDAVLCHYSAKTTKGHIKINSWAVNEEEGIATLCISLYQGAPNPTRLTKTDVEQALNQAVRAFEQAVDGFHRKMEPASVETFGMMRRLYEAQADIATVQIILLTDGLLPAELKKQRDRHGAYSFKYDFWDLQRLYRIVSSELPYESVEINLIERFDLQIPCLPPATDTDDHSVYLTILPGFVLSELYEEFGSQLLDLNVRSFLQARGKVNKGIRDTLCTQPRRFLAYNNGISATAEKVEIEQDVNGMPMIKSLTGFQIVNGGQTMASIHRAHKIEKADISSVFVQAKITEVIPGKLQELAPLISRYANTQNKVNEADFSSNDPFNVELQRLSEKVWIPGEQSRWFYERTRGQYQVERFRTGPTEAKTKQFERKCPPSQRFVKTEMAKYLNCWEQRPHVVSLGAQKNFVAFMDSLHERISKDWQPDEKYYKELIAKAILTKEADKLARNIGIQAYKANVVAYTVALLSERSLGRFDLMEIWNTQTTPAFVIETFRIWMPKVYEIIVRSAGQRNVTEWCKKEACWVIVRESDLALTLELKNELERSQPLPTVGISRLKGQMSLSSEDHENIARVMQVDAATWFRLSVWGQKKKRLRDWQCGLAHSLSGYATGGWIKVPSAKQALQAVRILKIAEDDGELLRD